MLKKFKLLTSQRGAMFGMDARIALAVFGTIAIAAGYVGISKLQTANDAAFIKEVLAIEDALESMQADLGVFLESAYDTFDVTERVAALNDSTYIQARFRARWKGPYLDGLSLTHKYGQDYRVNTFQADATTGCDISNDCFVVIRAPGVPASTWERFNQMIDENNGTTPEATPISEGRVQANSTADSRALIYLTRIKRRAG